MNKLDRDIEFLAEIHKKAYRIQNFEEIALTEGKVSVLTEDVTKEDLAALKTVIGNFEKRLDALKAQVKTLGSADALPVGDDATHPDAKEGLKTINDLVTAYDTALASLTKSYGQVSFEKGAFNFGAKMITIPGMVTITTEMLEDVTALVKGYEDFKKKINDVTNKVPKDKLEQSIFTLSQEENSTVPDADKIIEAAKQSFGQKNVLQKAVSFFASAWKGAKSLGGKALGGAAAGAGAGAIGGAAGAATGATIGAVGGLAASAVKTFLSSQDRDLKAIRAKVPQLKPAEIGEAFGVVFVSVKISTLKALPAPEAPPTVAAAQNAITHAAQSVTTQGTEAVVDKAKEKETGGAAESGTKLSTKEVNQLKTMRDKLSPEVQKLIDPVIKAGEEAAKARGKKAPAAPAAPSKTAESRTRNFLGDGQQLLTSRRHKIQENSENHDYDRWSILAGIK